LENLPPSKCDRHLLVHPLSFICQKKPRLWQPGKVKIKLRRRDSHQSNYNQASLTGAECEVTAKSKPRPMVIYLRDRCHFCCPPATGLRLDHVHELDFRREDQRHIFRLVPTVQFDATTAHARGAHIRLCAFVTLNALRAKLIKFKNFLFGLELVKLELN
jgi:hypothetical protein